MIKGSLENNGLGQPMDDGNRIYFAERRTTTSDFVMACRLSGKASSRQFRSLRPSAPSPLEKTSSCIAAIMSLRLWYRPAKNDGHMCLRDLRQFLLLQLNLLAFFVLLTFAGTGPSEASVGLFRSGCNFEPRDEAYLAEMHGNDPTTNLENRIALVIANRLDGEDFARKTRFELAQEFAVILSSVGFDVFLGIDIDDAGVRDCLEQFETHANEKQPELAVFFYSGSTKLDNTSEGQRDRAATVLAAPFLGSSADLGLPQLDFDQIVKRLANRSDSTLVFFDAQLHHLPSIEGIPEVVISSANAPGQTIEGTHYAFSLLENMLNPGQSVAETLDKIFTEVRDYNESRVVAGRVSDPRPRSESQRPWSVSNVTKEILLNGGLSKNEIAERSLQWAIESKKFASRGLQNYATVAALKGVPQGYLKKDVELFQSAFEALSTAVSGNEVRFNGHTDKVTQSCISSGGRVATVSADRTIRSWNFRGFPLAVKKIESLVPVRSLLCEENDRVIVGNAIGEVTTYALVDLGKVGKPRAFGTDILTISRLLGETIVVLDDGSIWSFTTCDTQDCDSAKKLWPRSTFADDNSAKRRGQFIASSGSTEGTIALLDRNLSLTILTGTRDGDDELTLSEASKRVLPEYFGRKPSIKMSPKGEYLILADQRIYLEEVESGRGGRLLSVPSSAELESSRMVPARFTAVDVATNDQGIVVGTERGALHIWSPETLKWVNSIQIHEGAVNSIAIAHDGTSILTSSSDFSAVLTPWISMSSDELISFALEKLSEAERAEVERDRIRYSEVYSVSLR